MSSVIVGGFDPSMSNFGMTKGSLCLNTGTFKILDLCLETSESSKVKQVRKNSDDLERARKLHKGMQNFFSDCAFVCVEIPVGSQSARAMASYGMCIGLIASLNRPLIQVTPKEVKVAATGKKTATKNEMIKWATGLYPYAPWLTKKVKGQTSFTNANEHLADAIASIHAGVRTDQFKTIKSMHMGMTA